jgi:hypothetical protein
MAHQMPGGFTLTGEVTGPISALTSKKKYPTPAWFA